MYLSVGQNTKGFSKQTNSTTLDFTSIFFTPKRFILPRDSVNFFTPAGCLHCDQFRRAMSNSPISHKGRGGGILFGKGGGVPTSMDTIGVVGVISDPYVDNI